MGGDGTKMTAGQRRRKRNSSPRWSPYLMPSSSTASSPGSVAAPAPTGLPPPSRISSFPRTDEGRRSRSRTRRKVLQRAQSQTSSWQMAMSPMKSLGDRYVHRNSDVVSAMHMMYVDGLDGQVIVYIVPSDS